MPELLYDYLSRFSAVDMGQSPLDLPRDVLTAGYNISLRGRYAHPRPPFFKKVLEFGGDTALQTSMETGFFQGAGYYRPDFGQSSLVAQIGGRLYAFTEQSGGGSWTVTDITVPGDPNDATTNQVWMFQAEKWLIVNDGTGNLPIFYDSVTSRRSFGPSQVLGTATAFIPANPPAINATVEVTLNADWTGPYNVPVLFNGAYYQPIQNSGSTPSYSVILTNVAATPGVTIDEGSSVVVQPSVIGKVRAFSAWTPFGSPSVAYYRADLLSSGDLLPVAEMIASGQAFKKLNELVSPGYNFRIRADAPSVGTPTPLVVGDLIYASGAIDPAVPIGNVQSDFIVPAVGGTVTIELDMPYSGATGQTVWIESHQFTIEPVPPPAPSTTLTLLNLTDTDAGAYVNPTDILSVPELPAGRMGAYGQSHATLSLTDGISFIYGDTLGGPSGTPANNYRDSVLKTTENDFLNEQGAFRIPNAGEIITSMTFVNLLDASLGQGPLQLGTSTSMYSCLVPNDRAVWAVMTSPILPASLKGLGPINQNATGLANSDTFFRTPEGISTLVMARRDFFDTWGNVPISREVEAILKDDDQSLLQYGSAVNFDNRRFHTCRPQVSNQGVFHIGNVVINFDPVSNIRGKAPSIWEGAWTGLNVLQWVSGYFNGVSRTFAFAWSFTEQKIEIWEALREATTEYADNGVTPISWQWDSAALFHPDLRSPEIPLIKLENGRIHIAELKGSAHIAVYYKPDFWPCWTLWHEFDICADQTANNSQPGYKTMLGLGEPSVEECSTATDRPLRVGRFFQIQFRATGSFKFMGAEFSASPMPEVQFPAPICDT